MATLIKGFKKPSSIDFKISEQSSNYGKFVVEPFERGFGTTIGNALRRALLSSVEGSAITAIKIENVFHEFSSIPGVFEDLTRIILNLKKVRLIYETEKRDEPKVIHIEKKGAGILTAGDLSVDSSIQILNPDLVIAHLNDEANLVMDLQIERGRGYIPAENLKKNIEELGTIPIDALFSPIQKVNFFVEELRLGTRNDYEKLTVEIWTDGSIKPEEALSYAAIVLKEQLSIFIKMEEAYKVEEESEMQEIDQTLKANLEKHVEELEFSVRSLSLLKSLEIDYIIDLVKKQEDEFQKSKHYSSECVDEIKEKLRSLNLDLGMKDIPFVKE